MVTPKEKLRCLEKDIINIFKAIRKSQLETFFMFKECVLIRRKLSYPCTAIFLYEMFDKYAELGFSFYCKLLKYVDISNEETDEILKESSSKKSRGNKATGLSLNKTLMALSKCDNTKELNTLLTRIESEKWSTHKIHQFNQKDEFNVSMLCTKLNYIEELYDLVDPCKLNIQSRGNVLTKIKQHKNKTEELIKRFDDGLLK